jgi:hypothetical protein
LTSERVIYRPLKGHDPLIGKYPGTIELPLRGIAAVKQTKSERSVLNPFPKAHLQITTTDDRAYTFDVLHPETWVRQIEQARVSANNASRSDDSPPTDGPSRSS